MTMVDKKRRVISFWLSIGIPLGFFGLIALTAKVVGSKELALAAIAAGITGATIVGTMTLINQQRTTTVSKNPHGVVLMWCGFCREQSKCPKMPKEPIIGKIAPPCFKEQTIPFMTA